MKKRLTLVFAAIAATMVASQAWAALSITIIEAPDGSPAGSGTVSWSPAWLTSPTPTVFNGGDGTSTLDRTGVGNLYAPAGSWGPVGMQGQNLTLVLWEYGTGANANVKMWSDTLEVQWGNPNVPPRLNPGPRATVQLYSDVDAVLFPIVVGGVDPDGLPIPGNWGPAPVLRGGPIVWVEEQTGIMTFAAGSQYTGFDDNNGYFSVVLPFDLNIQSEAVPVPEPTTMIAGVLLLLPFGASTLRILRKNRKA